MWITNSQHKWGQMNKWDKWTNGDSKWGQQMGTGTIFPIFLWSNFSLDALHCARSFQDDD